MDETILRYNVSINNKSTRNISILFVSVTMALYLANYVYFSVVNFFGIAIWLTTLIHFITNSYRVAIGMLYKSWIHSVKQRFKALNKLLRIKRKNIQMNEYHIQEVAIKYRKLFLITETLNECGLTPFLIVTSTNFIWTVTLAYTFSSIIIRNVYTETRTIIFTGISSFIYIMDIVTLIYFCDQLKYQVSTFFACWLHFNTVIGV